MLREIIAILENNFSLQFWCLKRLKEFITCHGWLEGKGLLFGLNIPIHKKYKQAESIILFKLCAVIEIQIFLMKL